MIYYLSKVSQNSLLLNIVMIYESLAKTIENNPVHFQEITGPASQLILIFGNRPKISQFAITDNAMHCVLKITWNTAISIQ